MMETVLYFRFTSQVNFISEIRIIIMLLYLISFSFHYLVQADAFIAAIQIHNHFDYDDVENNKQTKKKNVSLICSIFTVDASIACYECARFSHRTKQFRQWRCRSALLIQCDAHARM